MQLKIQTTCGTVQHVGLVDPHTSRYLCVVKGWTPGIGLDNIRCEPMSLKTLGQHLATGIPFETNFFQLYTKDSPVQPIESSYCQLMKRFGWLLANLEYRNYSIVPQTLVAQPTGCRQVRTELTNQHFIRDA